MRLKPGLDKYLYPAEKFIKVSTTWNLWMQEIKQMALSEKLWSIS